MSADYRSGRISGLREAAEILRGLEEAVARKLARPAPRATREARRVRHKALQVGAKRIETTVRKIERSRDRSVPLSSALAEFGITEGGKQ